MRRNRAHSQFLYIKRSMVEKTSLIAFFLYILIFPVATAASTEGMCTIDKPCGNNEELSEHIPETKETSSNPVCLYFFYSTACPHCLEVKDFLSEMKGKYPTLAIKSHDARLNMDLYNSILSAYNVPECDYGQIPIVFIAGNCCIGSKKCIATLEDEIKRCLREGCECLVVKEPSALKLTLLGVGCLAAVDAVNVCALAVMVILITSVLTRFPEQRRKMLYTGLTFICALFTAYFITGLFLVLGIKSISAVSALQTSGIYKLFGWVAIILGVLNLKDFFKYGGGGFKLEVPESWRPRMKRIIASTTSPAGAFIVGLLVSMFLIPCIIGPYFVAGGLLSGLTVGRAIPWLLLYNVVFILPMLIIVLVIYAGFAAIKDIEAWRERNIRKLHLVAGSILSLVGLIIVFGLI
jgi:glutaredoxin